MADPIEIIQTVISVSQQIYGVVKSIQGAPDELKSIDHAVSLLLPILGYLVETLGKRVQEEHRDRDATALRGLCEQARELVDKANGFLGSSNDGTFKLRKKEWPRWLMKKIDREDLTKRFHDLHGAISVYLSYDVHREMTVELRVIQTDIREVYDSISTIQRDIGQHQDPYGSERNLRLGYQMAQRVMRSAAQSQTQDLNQHYDEVTTANTGTLVRASMLRPDPATRPDSLEPCTAYHGSLCNDLCPPSCRCRCHHPPLTPIPQFLRPMVGSISIDHDIVSGLRSILTPCNDQECRRQRSNLLKIKYHCPTWFAQINAEIRAERIPVHFVIQTPRVVQDIAWMQGATLDEVRQKLCSRELTVNDVRPNGNTVLHIATFRLTWDRSDTALSIVALLTEHSAPTDWECEGLTPTERALWWSFVFWRHYGSRTAATNALRHTLSPHLSQDIDDAYEELTVKLHWTGLHRLICLLSSPTFTTVPPELASHINIKDSSGRTSLFYAALGSPEVIHALLAAGANSRLDDTLLGWAAQAGAEIAISILVRAGALPNASDVEKRTALHWAANPIRLYSIHSLAVALELVRHAGHLLDWDARDSIGRTPLDWARIRVNNHPDDADSERMLELYQARRLPDGARYIPASPILTVWDDFGGDDSTGLPRTSLIRAGLRGDVDAIGDLIRRGAMVNERDHDGRTLLHLVALGKVQDGYRVALELARHGGWGVDWGALVAKGEGKNKEHEGGTHEGDGSEESENDEQVQVTALEIAQARLDKDVLSEQERGELEKIRDLLGARRLPPGERYLWPCMNPDFYESEPELEPIPSIPGAWNDE